MEDEGVKGQNEGVFSSSESFDTYSHIDQGKAENSDEKKYRILYENQKWVNKVC